MTMKIAIQSKGGVIKYVAADELTVDGMTLATLFNRAAQIEAAYNKLTKQLKRCVIAQDDKPYIIDFDGELKKVDRLKLYEDIKNDYPLKFYHVESGRLTLDKKKVGVYL